jgi:hypothetical protein
VVTETDEDGWKMIVVLYSFMGYQGF